MRGFRSTHLKLGLVLSQPQLELLVALGGVLEGRVRARHERLVLRQRHTVRVQLLPLGLEVSPSHLKHGVTLVHVERAGAEALLRSGGLL